MTKTKQASLSSKDFFDTHKEVTRSDKNEITTNQTMSENNKKRMVALLCADTRAKQATNEFKHDAEIKKADYQKIKAFVIERVGDPKKVTKEDWQEAVDFFYNTSDKKESKETLTNLPLDVATQETKAVAYFERNDESKHLKIVDHVKKLREEGKISYEDLGGGKYNVIMPCGSKKLKMYFPADIHLSDNNYNYIDFDGKEILKKGITKGKLWSKKGEKYVEQKEKEGQKMLSESEFKTLIPSLYPEGTEQEQILVFMMATGFYGRMRLSDKIGDFQRAVQCFRKSINRDFYSMKYDFDNCSLVHSTFIR